MSIKIYLLNHKQLKFMLDELKRKESKIVLSALYGYYAIYLN